MHVHLTLSKFRNYAYALVGTVILSLMFLFPPPINSAAATIEVQLDAEPISFSVNPIIDDGTTLVQFRPLFDAMGLEIEWDGDTKSITGKKEGFLLSLQIDNRQATVNGDTIEMLQAPRIVDGNTVVPIRFISESTGAIVSWNPYVPEIVIFTEGYWTAEGLTREELEDQIQLALAIIKERNESQQEEEDQQGGHPFPKGDGSYEQSQSDQVNIEQLEGMYVGYRVDRNGYECGGLCSDFYTFLPNTNVVIGMPKNGGPETINCDYDECHTYQISNDQLKVNGETFDIHVADGVLFIDDIEMERVVPVNDDHMLSNTYEHIGYYGAAGLIGYSVSWTYTLVFDTDGTFESDIFRLGSLDSGAVFVQGLSGDDSSGTYEINRNTIELTHIDGNVERFLYFEFASEEFDYEGIQIGEQVYYLQ